MKTNIVLYTLPVCPRCEDLKQSITDLGLPYEIRNMEDSEVMAGLWCDNVVVQEAPVLQINGEYYYGNTLYTDGEIRRDVIEAVRTAEADASIENRETEDESPVESNLARPTLIEPPNFSYVMEIPPRIIPTENTDICIVCGHPLRDHIDEGEGWRCCASGIDDRQCECFLRKEETFDEGILYYGRMYRLLERVKRIGYTNVEKIAYMLARAEDDITAEYVRVYGDPKAWTGTVCNEYAFAINKIRKQFQDATFGQSFPYMEKQE